MPLSWEQHVPFVASRVDHIKVRGVLLGTFYVLIWELYQFVLYYSNIQLQCRGFMCVCVCVCVCVECSVCVSVICFCECSVVQCVYLCV